MPKSYETGMEHESKDAKLPTEEEIAEFRKFTKAWDTMTTEEKRYMGGHYADTGHADEFNPELDFSGWKKLDASGEDYRDRIFTLLDKGTDANYWTDEEMEDFMKKREENKQE